MRKLLLAVLCGLTLLLCGTYAAALDAPTAGMSTTAAIDGTQTPVTDKVTGNIEQAIYSHYVYPATGDTVNAVVSRTVGYVSYKAVTWEGVLFESPHQDGQEQELNLYLDKDVKTPVGVVKFDGTIGEWWVSDGHITNVYAEISREFTLGKNGKVTLAPVLAFGQWVGSGYEPSKAYVLVGGRAKYAISDKVTLSLEMAVSHCIREDARLTTDQCHEVLYANTEIAYKLSEQWTVSLRGQVINRAPATFAIAFSRTF
jgi:hypothetical protein